MSQDGRRIAVWALLALANQMGSSRLYWTGAPAGAGDDILVSADKSSNRKGVEALAPNAKPYSLLLDDVRGGVVTHVVALGSATPEGGTDDASTLGMLRALVTIAAHDDGALTALAHVVLPACSWAEATGTYVNKDGLRQLSDKAIEPIGASKPGWEQVAAVAKALGHDLGIKRVKEIRAAWLGNEAAVHASPAEQ